MSSFALLGQNKFRFNRNTYLRVHPIHSLLKNNRMSPQHFSFHNSVVLREVSGREYERIANTLFYEFITRHAYVLQM